MSTAPRTTRFVIPGPVGNLEALRDEPEGRGAHVAVIAHPHPLYGGTMTNKVVHILARACNDLGAVAVRFNFRGVGASSGTHDDGRGETEDLLAALRWAADHHPGAQPWLAGFSFGAAIALRASFRFPVARLITVAPALRWLTQVDSEVPACPWLILQGDRDELVDVQQVRAWAQKLRQPPRLRILEGATHFFHGQLNELRDAVKSWLQEGDAGAVTDSAPAGF